MNAKLRAHILQLPRWFAAPFFGASLLMGVVLAGGFKPYWWLGLIAGMLIMAGGHAFNSFLDWKMGLDRGEVGERSMEKGYTGAQNLIAGGIVSLGETAVNGAMCYALALAPLIYLALHGSPIILVVGVIGMAITFWYSWGKFNWTHELALGVGVGPVALLMGMYSVNPNPPWVTGLLVSLPFAIVLAFAGLALDEWPDAEANLKKGVKSMAYMVWQYSDWTLEDISRKKVNTLCWYLTSWFLFLFIYQLMLINLKVLSPLTAWSFVCFPFLMAFMVMLKLRFRKFAVLIVIVGAAYVILLLIGQAIGG